MTRKAFVVGHPITHSRSPLIHGHWLAEHGIDGSYERVAVAPEDFEEFFRGLPESAEVTKNTKLMNTVVAITALLQG